MWAIGPVPRWCAEALAGSASRARQSRAGTRGFADIGDVEENSEGPRKFPSTMMASPMNDHDRQMELALEQARQALAHDDVPIGAIVVRDADSEVLGVGHNERELRQDPTAHAEILAL